jgi:lysophospholipase L1-like esterase
MSFVTYVRKPLKEIATLPFQGQGVLVMVEDLPGNPLCDWAGTSYTVPFTSAQAAAVAAAGRLSCLPRWATALANVRAGTGNARLMVLGDSTSAGAFANSGAGFASNNMASCWPYLLAPLFTAQGYTPNIGSVFGDVTNSTIVATLVAHDTRRAIGANWTLGAFITFGGNVLSNANATTTLASFTPAAAFDTIIVTTINNAGYGVMSVAIDGGATLQDINLATGGSVVTRTTMSVPRGTHRIDLFRAIADGASIRNINCVSIETTDSTKRTVDIINASVGGITCAITANTTAYFNSLSVFPNYNPDLTIICIGINDWVAGTAAGTYDLVTAGTVAVNTQKIIDSARLSGDVILMTPVPSKVSSYTQAAQNLILAAIRTTGALSNVPIVDLYANWGNYVAGTTAGYYLPNIDAVHPGAAGYTDMASRVAGVRGLFGAT